MNTIGRITVVLLAGWLTVAANAVEPQRVGFTTGDGVQIVGDYYAPTPPGPAPAAILLHMFRSDRSAWRPLAKALREAGIATLAIDMRGHGESVKPARRQLNHRMAQRDQVLFGEMHLDVAAAITWLAGRLEVDTSRLALVGASVGCSVAIDTARRDRSVDVVVCMTPGERYLGLDSVTHIAEFAKYGRRPILLLATPAERQASDRLQQVYPGATERIVGEGRIHGTQMFGRVKNVESDIVSFIRKHVGTPSDGRVAAAVDGHHFFPPGSKADVSIETPKHRWFSSAKEAEDRGLAAGDPDESQGKDPHNLKFKEFKIKPLDKKDDESGS